jgi:hypothetical protein
MAKSPSFCAAFIESRPLKSKLLIHLSMKSIPLHRCVQQARRVAAARPRVGELAANLQTSTAAHIKGLHRHHSQSAAAFDFAYIIFRPVDAFHRCHI